MKNVFYHLFRFFRCLRSKVMTNLFDATEDKRTLYAHVTSATKDNSISAADRYESARQQFKTEDSDEYYHNVPMTEETIQKVEKQNGECTCTCIYICPVQRNPR